MDSIITIPDVETLSESEQIAVLKKAEYGQTLQIRDRYRKTPFSIFVDEVRDRRRWHGLGVDVHLLLDSQQQSQQENWIEFQNYYLKHHERLEKKRDGLKKELDDAQKEGGDTDIVLYTIHCLTERTLVC